MDARLYSLAVAAVLLFAAMLAGLGYISVDDKEFFFGLLVGGGGGVAAGYYGRGRKDAIDVPPSLK